MLEEKAGLVTGLSRRCDCVPLHGSLANLKCHLCHEAYGWQDYRCHIEDYVIKDRKTEDGDTEGDKDEDKLTLPLPCPQCSFRCQIRKEAGMRPLPIGQLRPGMIMLDETYPQGGEIVHLARGDKLASPDLLLVLGTSLKVDGPKRLLRQFARSIHQQGGKVIYVNLSKPPSDCSASVDYWVEWDVDEWVRDLKGRQDRSERGMRTRQLAERLERAVSCRRTPARFLISGTSERRENRLARGAIRSPS